MNPWDEAMIKEQLRSQYYGFKLKKVSWIDNYVTVKIKRKIKRKTVLGFKVNKTVTEKFEVAIETEFYVKLYGRQYAIGCGIDRHNKVVYWSAYHIF